MQQVNEKSKYIESAVMKHLEKQDPASFSFAEFQREYQSAMKIGSSF
jgi:hypothetical protein